MTSCLSLTDLESLYRTHAYWLLRLLKNQIGHAFLAEDITQETFIKVMVATTVQTHQALRDNPKALLQTIAKRLLIDSVRAEVIAQKYHEQYALLQGKQSDYDLEAHVAAIQTLVQLSKSLDECNERERRCFMLYYFDGLSQAEIAKRLHLSHSTVKRCLAKIVLYAYQLEYSAS